MIGLKVAKWTVALVAAAGSVRRLARFQIFVWNRTGNKPEPDCCSLSLVSRLLKGSCSLERKFRRNLLAVFAFVQPKKVVETFHWLLRSSFRRIRTRSFSFLSVRCCNVD